MAVVSCLVGEAEWGALAECQFGYIWCSVPLFMCVPALVHSFPSFPHPQIQPLAHYKVVVKMGYYTIKVKMAHDKMKVSMVSWITAGGLRWHSLDTQPVKLYGLY